ncbi:MAG: hemerythrin family protein [Thiotrichaceae bacterium]|nr:hemerythrin family protein [Thiotrichaceae bacterium]
MSKNIMDEESIPLVDIDFMNDTHSEELQRVNLIGKLVREYQEKSGDFSLAEVTHLSKMMESWLEHSDAHFARENELMQEFNFPAYYVHLNEHEIALNKMKSVISEWNTNYNIDLVADYVLVLWPAWFISHVNTLDMVTAKFAKLNGYKLKVKA